jgi:predicted enzyme related to lactoylglutathione lyase
LRKLKNMISKITHTNLFVLDQESACDFYVNKLGFKINTDAMMGPDMRWLTVSPPDQPDFEISLMPVREGFMFNEEAAKAMKELVQKSTFGFAVFQCRDLMATYAEMKAKGVEFVTEPKQETYGFVAMFKDDSGNWFSLSQKE